MLKDRQDACGHEFLDYYEKREGYEIVERDDGYLDISYGPAEYFKDPSHWQESVLKALTFARGRVLDIGCGAGRHSLFLQQQGHDVLAIDNSPLAIKVCQLRGVRKTQVLPITKLSKQLGIFNTIIMMGNNLALFGSIKRAKWLLKRFSNITSDNGLIIGQILDPYQTDKPEHLEYQNLNRSRNRMPGQVRIRIRYKNFITPYFDYLFLSREELTHLLEDSGWFIKQHIDGLNGTYTVILEKVQKVAA